MRPIKLSGRNREYLASNAASQELDARANAREAAGEVAT